MSDNSEKCNCLVELDNLRMEVEGKKCPFFFVIFVGDKYDVISHDMDLSQLLTVMADALIRAKKRVKAHRTSKLSKIRILLKCH